MRSRPPEHLWLDPSTYATNHLSDGRRVFPLLQIGGGAQIRPRLSTATLPCAGPAHTFVMLGYKRRQPAGTTDGNHMVTLTLATAQKLVEAVHDSLNPARAEASQSLILRYADAIDAGTLYDDAATREQLARHLFGDA